MDKTRPPATLYLRYGWCRGSLTIEICYQLTKIVVNLERSLCDSVGFGGSYLSISGQFTKLLFYEWRSRRGQECIRLDSGRGCIKLRNFNKDISKLYQYIRMVLKFLFIFLGGMKNALVDIRYHGWHGTASDLVAADLLDLCAVSMEMFDCKTWNSLFYFRAKWMLMLLCKCTTGRKKKFSDEFPIK